MFTDYDFASGLDDVGTYICTSLRHTHILIQKSKCLYMLHFVNHSSVLYYKYFVQHSDQVQQTGVMTKSAQRPFGNHFILCWTYIENILDLESLAGGEACGKPNFVNSGTWNFVALAKCVIINPSFRNLTGL